MKRFVFIAICIVGLLSLSSCRSTSDPCGLAEHSTKQTKQLQDPSTSLLPIEVI